MSSRFSRNSEAIDFSEIDSRFSLNSEVNVSENRENYFLCNILWKELTTCYILQDYTTYEILIFQVGDVDSKSQESTFL